MTIQELINNPNYKLHHTSSRRGYLSRKSQGRVYEYNGRFGKGYILETPRFDTTQYTYISYFILKD